MKQFSTRIEILAPVEAVWNILTDLPNWARWNSTVERTEGKAELSAKITIFVKQSPGRAFPLTVAELVAPRRMVWTGGMPMGLFRGTRVYELSAASSALTIFTMTETFKGLLAPLIGKSIPDLQPSFDEFARCLKREAERG